MILKLVKLGRYRTGMIYLIGVFLGVCIVFISAMLSLSTTDQALTDAAVLFAAAIPVLVTSLLLTVPPRTRILGFFVLLIGLVMTVFGIGRPLAHIDVAASASFIISVVACFLLVFIVDLITRFTYISDEQPDHETPSAPADKLGEESDKAR